MTAPAHAPVITFLRRTGLIAAVLALIAGIFGMHVMTATHAMHTPAAAAATISTVHHDPSPAGLQGEHPAGPSSAKEIPAAQDGAATRTVRCTDSNHCTSTQGMTASCTPSAKTGSLAAPLPGTGTIPRHAATVTQRAVSALWSYLPESPTPGELCISRT